MQLLSNQTLTPQPTSLPLLALALLMTQRGLPLLSSSQAPANKMAA